MGISAPMVARLGVLAWMLLGGCALEAPESDDTGEGEPLALHLTGGEDRITHNDDPLPDPVRRGTPYTLTWSGPASITISGAHKCDLTSCRVAEGATVRVVARTNQCSIASIICVNGATTLASTYRAQELWVPPLYSDVHCIVTPARQDAIDLGFDPCKQF